jgi:ABC-type antimicrobial peptide transport system permease subunit
MNERVRHRTLGGSVAPFGWAVQSHSLGAAVSLTVIGALAGWLPAYHAARTNPSVALRDE